MWNRPLLKTRKHKNNENTNVQFVKDITFLQKFKNQSETANSDLQTNKQMIS